MLAGRVWLGAGRHKKEVSTRNLGQLLPVFAYTKCTACTHTHTNARLHTQAHSPHTGGQIIRLPLLLDKGATEVACMIGYYGLGNMKIYHNKLQQTRSQLYRHIYFCSQMHLSLRWVSYSKVLCCSIKYRDKKALPSPKITLTICYYIINRL